MPSIRGHSAALDSGSEPTKIKVFDLSFVICLKNRFLFLSFSHSRMRMLTSNTGLILAFLCSLSFLLLHSFQGIRRGRDSAGDSGPAGSRRHGLHESPRQAQYYHIRLPVLQLLQQQVSRYEHVVLLRPSSDGRDHGSHLSLHSKPPQHEEAK